MKALTLTQPWATLVAIGAKRIETRSWRSYYTGPLAIHAAKTFPAEARAFASTEPCAGVLAAAGLAVDALPQGAVVAVATCVGGQRFRLWTRESIASAVEAGTYPPHEVHFGDFTDGRWGLWLTGVRRVQDPVACAGKLGIWELPDDVTARVMEQLL